MAKKLTRKTLDELAETMTILSKKEQMEVIGGLKNDCFFRCISFLMNGNGTDSEVEQLVQFYYSRCLGVSEDNLSTVNAFLETEEMQNSGVAISGIQAERFINMARNDRRFHLLFQTSSKLVIRGGGGGALGHYLVAFGEEENGMIKCYDAQNFQIISVHSSELRNIPLNK